MEQFVNLTITDKTDVYSFGMVLFEVVSGKKYMSLITEEEFPIEEKVDPKIKGKIAPESWQVFIDIMQECLKYEVDERPTMGEVEYTTIIEELCHRFSLADIRKSTDNFDHKRLIGYGGFDIGVYKGCLQHDGSDYTVTIKRFKADGPQRWNLFKNEIELLCQLRDPNCITLIGFCSHKKEKILVYEYMSNGSLHRHLQHGDLSWKKRLEICIGAARGLHYLHSGAKRTIIHCDFSSKSILLNDDMEPKLADFSFCRQGAPSLSKPKPIKVDCVTSTSCFIAQEYSRDGTITDKCDVYSFGWVLKEVVFGTGYLIEEVPGRPVEDIIDKNIKRNIAPECWRVIVDIIQRCVQYNPHERPTMGEVELELEHALSLQERADIANTNGDYTLFSKTIIKTCNGEEDSV
ncbi:receptor-like protein kinase ANXUR2 [Vigna umbellata]|uniref:receptor-like protein kinase ANXUR2 n=1 Tax=Vigna umbellata TaxID=87088 RepID=UPI001F5E7766|nr:receptor-like protein kinase ANXUR2 [Vigna umbellata]